MKSYKSHGIVLNTLKYGESSIIAHLLTDTFGRQSYIIQGVGSSRGRGSKTALFQPMFALRFEGLASTRSDLHRMRDIESGILLRTTPYDIRKSTISLFMAEVLYRLVGESETNQALFDFVWGSVEALDEAVEGVANFHLWFLANLSRFLGFSPSGEWLPGCWFDMREGCFTPIKPLHDNIMRPEYAALFRDLLECDVQYLAEIGLNRRQRVEMLDAMVAYYTVHLDSIRTVRSIGVLQEVF